MPYTVRMTYSPMPDKEQVSHRQILEGADLAFLQKTRGELQALLDTRARWTELMRNLIGSIPRENGMFGQDVLGKNLLKGIPTEEVDVALADTGPEERLQALLKEIDKRIAVLTQEQSSAGESLEQQKKSAA